MQTEIKIHRSLRHVNIVKFERYFEDHDHAYILLELCNHNVRNRCNSSSLHLHVIVQVLILILVPGLILVLLMLILTMILILLLVLSADYIIVAVLVFVLLNSAAPTATTKPVSSTATIFFNNTNSPTTLLSLHSQCPSL